MCDLISRQDAIDAIKEMCRNYTETKSEEHPHVDFVIEELMNIPSTESEIIRCKDCIHYPNPNADCPMIGWTRNEDDFCSYAERREE